jgi:hypothetical protein
VQTLRLDIPVRWKQTLRQILLEVLSMKIRPTVAVAVLSLVVAAIPAFAHHSFAAEFDAAQRITLTGVVTKVEWTNPHVWFWVNVKDEKTGQLTNWGLEMGTIRPTLLRSSWMVKDSVAHPARVKRSK